MTHDESRIPAPSGRGVVKANKEKTGGAKPFNILAQGASIVDATRESLGRSASDVLMVGTPNKPKNILPLSSFAFQNILKARGLVTGTIMDIMGADGIGKTSLAYYLMGQAMAANGVCLYIETEGKPLDRSRAERCLHPNRKIAAQMYDSIYQEPARELREAANKIEEWIIQMRSPGTKVPPSSPLIIFLDTFSKLMSPNEAAGFAAYATASDVDKAAAKEKAKAKKAKSKGKTVETTEKKEKADESKELGAGSNFGHAKLSQEWSRRLPYFLSRYNAILVLVRHQNDKIEMCGGGGGMMLTAEQKDAFNRTSIGGRAWLQSAAYGFILSRMDFVKSQIDGDMTKTALNIKVSLAKNGWGPLAEGKYRLTLVPRQDTEDWFEPAINFDPWLPELLSKKKLMKVTVKNATTVISTEFNPGGRSEEIPLDRFCDLFYSDPARVEALGRQLGFAHFDDFTIFPKTMTVSMHKPIDDDSAPAPEEDPEPESAADAEAAEGAVNADPNAAEGAPTGAVTPEPPKPVKPRQGKKLRPPNEPTA